MIVVDSAAVVDALTAVEGSEDLRAHLASEALECALLTRDARLARSGGHTVQDPGPLTDRQPAGSFVC